jgi:signal transduction histidine kinase
LPRNNLLPSIKQQSTKAFSIQKSVAVEALCDNTLSPSFKYSPDGGNVQFDLVCSETEAVVRIQDQDLLQLFESFTRCSNVGNIPETGLGLASVKKSLDLQGGQIIVDSTVGAGTTFIVTLPLTQN